MLDKLRSGAWIGGALALALGLHLGLSHLRARGAAHNASQYQSVIVASPPAVQSPFAPTDGVANGHAVLAHVRLLGVRVDADSARSGAVFSIFEQERAALVSQEIVPGARLVEVARDHVIIAVDDGRVTLALDRERTAQAAPLLSMSTNETELHAATQWLANSVLARTEETIGAPYGWRVRGEVPQHAAQAGLRRGDLIVAVNGIRPAEAPMASRAAARDPIVELVVVRSSGERETIWLHDALN